jgi:hypothetical protein
LVEFDIKIHPNQRTAYIPKEIVEALGLQLKAKANLKSVFLYPAGMAPKDKLQSLDTIRSDIVHEIEIEKRRKK